MAAGLADGLIVKLTEKLVQLVAKQTTLVVNFRKDFEWLSKKLTNIRDYLGYADGESRCNEPVRKWVENIRDIAWDAERILDECATAKDTGDSACVYSCTQVIFRYKMGRRIKDLKDRVVLIMQDAAELKLVCDLYTSQGSASTSSCRQRGGKGKKSCLLESDALPVAIDHKVQHILNLLDDPAVPVIAVVGMGGLGKTFLLHHVFDRARERFGISIWLSISQTYSLPKLQSDLASKLSSRDHKILLSEEQAADRSPVLGLRDVVKGRLSEVQAAELIHGRLKGTSSLIVLDDVWAATAQDNLIQTLGLPVGLPIDDKTKCKVVVSTRSREVCRNMNAHMYEMEHLSDEDSCKLFWAHAFPNCPQNKPPQHLQDVAHDIQKECGNLSLALKTIGSSLSSKTLVKEWKSKFRYLQEEVDSKHLVMHILKLSYDWLPPALKPCFAYLSFFPQDEKIDCEYLISLWIGEGFIAQQEYDIGWEYMFHLANLCLVKVVEEPGKGTKYCKLHDLLADLAVSISKLEDKCSFSVEDAITVESSSSSRRILLAKKGINNNTILESSINCQPRVCTLSLAQNYDIVDVPANLFANGRVMRVLDLSRTRICSLPKSVRNLKLLQVLNLSHTNIEKLPQVVSKLKSLCFLDISHYQSMERVPVWIGDLKCLQHLNIENCDMEMYRHMPKEISELLCLRTRRSDMLTLSDEDNGILKLEDTVNLILNVVNEGQLKKINEGILAPLVKIRTLQIFEASRRWGSAVPNSPCPEQIKDLKGLEHLRLRNFALPSWICSFADLRILVLNHCHCRDYSALALQTMGNLMWLELYVNRNCTKLPEGFGKSGEFPKLKFLTIELFCKLEAFPELEDGAMPCIEKLEFRQLDKLKKIPEGLERLKSLKECIFDSTGISEETLKEGGQDWNRIKTHNPHITITWKG